MSKQPTAETLFKTVAEPYRWQDEQRARLEQLYRLRAERLAREAEAPPPRKRT
jgi:hypothetical protein